jgi:hypothetical protein
MSQRTSAQPIVHECAFPGGCQADFAEVPQTALGQKINPSLPSEQGPVGLRAAKAKISQQLPNPKDSEAVSS